jgi:hypothetical protein
MSPNTKRTPKRLPSRFYDALPSYLYRPEPKQPSRRDRRRMLVRAMKDLSGK